MTSGWGLSPRRTFALLLILASASLGQEPPTYTNPVYPKDFPDPFVLVHEGHFYAYGTQTEGKGFQLLDSPDLVHWTPRDLELPVVWAKEHFWAPEVFRRGGQFFLTYSALDPVTRKHNIAVAMGESPLGPFRHRTFLVLGKGPGPGVIDATIFAEEDGAASLIYSEEDPRRIVLRRLKPDLLGVEDGEPLELIHPDQPWEFGVTEAPTILKRAGVYHLFYSAGPYEGTRDGPGYSVAHASSPALNGPYSKTPVPLMATVPDKVYGPGHPSVVPLPDANWWVVYHAWDAQGEPRYGRNPSGRTLRLDRLEWDGPAPKILGPTTTPRPSPAVPTLKVGPR